MLNFLVYYFLMFLSAFLNVVINELCSSLSHWLLVSSYMLTLLSANIKVLFDVIIVLLHCWSLFWKWFLIFQNLIFLTSSTRSFSKAIYFAYLDLQVIRLCVFSILTAFTVVFNILFPPFGYLTPVFSLIETNNFSPTVFECSSMNHPS